MRLIRRYWLLLFLLAEGVSMRAQKPEELLDHWSARSPIEKAYLHFDRDNYLSGETMWFKAYLYSDYFPDTISTSLYVELLNGSSAVLQRKILPVFWGNTFGQIELPDSLETGYYFIRAYTPTMLNADPAFLYNRTIFIYGKKNRLIQQPVEAKTDVAFFPEGGNFISNLVNTVAVKITNEYGLPVNDSGIIKNENNEVVAEFSSYHDGMSWFDMTPKQGGKYYAVLTGDSLGRKYYLPEPADKGIVFRLIPHPQGSYFDLGQKTGDPVFQAAYVVGQMQHHIVFRVDFPSYKDEMHGVINTLHLASGILQVTVFNKDGQPLAERLSFVDNREYVQPAELITDTLDFLAKAKNHFTIFLKDTVQGDISVSVDDPAYSLAPVREENIFSRLLLTADIKGYVHDPAYYFSRDDDSIKTARDLVMMTNGWRRFKWNDLLRGTIPPANYKDGGYITLDGQVSIRDTKKPVGEKQLLVFISGSDSARSMQMINTDKLGHFKIDSLLFFENARLLFSDIRGKKSQYIEVKLSGDSLARSFRLPPPERNLFYGSPFSAIKNSKMADDYDQIAKADGLMLQGVTVKTKKKNAIEELEEKYESGLFQGASEKTIDLTDPKEVVTQANIFDYLQFKVPGLLINKDGEDYSVVYRQFGSVSSMGVIPMTIYLDEIETDASFISSIPANQIALVKIFSSFVGAAGNGPGGVLAIYTKKGTDLSALMPSTADLVKYRGYSIIKEFYSPNYAVDRTGISKADHRITLQWTPSIFLNNVNAKIPVVFFNNDRSHQFRIVVEGMTRDGKMIHLEKIISSPDKKPF